MDENQRVRLSQRVPWDRNCYNIPTTINNNSSHDMHDKQMMNCHSCTWTQHGHMSTWHDKDTHVHDTFWPNVRPFRPKPKPTQTSRPSPFPLDHQSPQMTRVFLLAQDENIAKSQMSLHNTSGIQDMTNLEWNRQVSDKTLFQMLQTISVLHQSCARIITWLATCFMKCSMHLNKQKTFNQSNTSPGSIRLKNDTMPRKRSNDLTGLYTDIGNITRSQNTVYFSIM